MPPLSWQADLSPATEGQTWEAFLKDMGAGKGRLVGLQEQAWELAVVLKTPPGACSRRGVGRMAHRPALPSAAQAPPSSMKVSRCW